MFDNISDLTARDSENAKIKAKVMRIRQFNTKNGPAMSIILKDKYNSKIQCIFWPETYSKFNNKLKEFKSYEFTYFGIQKIRYPRYNKTDHIFEIVISLNTKIKEVQESIIIKNTECVEIKSKIKGNSNTVKQPTITNYFREC